MHEVPIPYDEEDWTESFLQGGCEKEEKKLRYQRYLIWKEQLQAGQPIKYRLSGSPLYPRACCMLEPVGDPDNLKVSDIVFCEVQPGGLFFADMMIYDIQLETDLRPTAESAPCRKFTIGNMSGLIIGHCWDVHIYGRLVEVPGVQEVFDKNHNTGNDMDDGDDDGDERPAKRLKGDLEDIGLQRTKRPPAESAHS